MLKLYHGSTSVCSAKVRVGLAERGLDWEGQVLNLAKGDQNADWYLALNPKGVVPTLVDDDLVIVESSVILEYIDRLGDGPGLMPADPQQRVAAAMWLTECIDIHAAINTMTFSTGKRRQILSSKTPEEIEAGISRMANPFNAMKRRDILDNGVTSPHVEVAFFTLRLMFQKMQSALEQTPWLVGQGYSIADAAIIAYVDRLDRLGLGGLWATYPCVQRWLDASRQRPSYDVAIGHYAGSPDEDRQKNMDAGNWEEVAPLWQAFLQRHSPD